MTPEKLSVISQLWLTGHNQVEIGNRIGVSRTTIAFHLEKTIKPLWRRQLVFDAEEELARIGHLERVAWASWNAAENLQSRETVKELLVDNGAYRDLVERAVITTSTTGEAKWLDVVKWCIEQRCKICGHYAQDHRHIAPNECYRVAGRSPAETNQIMMPRVLEKIAERHQYEQAIERLGQHS